MKHVLAAITALLVAGCSFDPPTANPTNIAIGEPCFADGQCVSGTCNASGGALGQCVECSSAVPCSGNLECSGGRCVSNVPGPHQHQGTVGGVRRTNDTGRTHVGRVAVAPIRTVVAR